MTNRNMNVEQGILCEVCGDHGKVRIGKKRIRDVKINPLESYEEGDTVKILMGLVLCKV